MTRLEMIEAAHRLLANCPIKPPCDSCEKTSAKLREHANRTYRNEEAANAEQDISNCIVKKEIGV